MIGRGSFQKQAHPFGERAHLKASIDIPNLVEGLHRHFANRKKWWRQGIFLHFFEGESLPVVAERREAVKGGEVGSELKQGTAPSLVTEIHWYGPQIGRF